MKALLLLALLTTTATTLPRVSDGKYGFGFVAPRFYDEAVESRRDESDYIFKRNPYEPDARWLEVRVIPQLVTFGDGFDTYKAHWRRHPIDVAVVHKDVAGTPSAVLTTFVPLSPKPLSIVLIGPARDEAQLVADLNAVLESLDGTPGWKTPWQRASPYVGFALAFTLVGAWIVLRGKERVNL
jgi:hypothetical protein